MKKFLCLFICLCMFFCLTACKDNSENDYSSSVYGTATDADGEGSDGKDSADSLEWIISPSVEVDDIACIIGSEDVSGNTDYNGLAFYLAGDRYGVINAEGEFFTPLDNNITWCFVCGFTNNHDTVYYPDGSQGISYGHGGISFQHYYSNALQCTILTSWGSDPTTDCEFNKYFASDAQRFIIPVLENLENTEESSCISYYTLDDSEYIGSFTGQYAIVNTDGQAVTDTRYSYFRPVSESVNFMAECYDNPNNYPTQLNTSVVSDYFCVKNLSGTWDYISADGTVLLGGFQDALPFHEGYAAVQNESGMWGYIDKNGQTVIPFVLEDASSVFDGSAWAKLNGKWGRLKLAESQNLPCYKDFTEPETN